MSTKATRQAGLTFIELIAFIVIVGVAVIGIMQTLSFSVRNSADPLRRKQALLLAEGLLEEVQQASFTFCDPSDETANPTKPSDCAVPELVGRASEPASSRPYDNVNDYVTTLGVAEAAFNNGAGVLVDATGTPFGLTGYSATLAIRAEALNGIASTSTADGQNVLRATVRVTYGTQTGDYVELDAYRTRYAPQVAQ
jgi:MSHA pilin protein MshD